MTKFNTRTNAQPRNGAGFVTSESTPSTVTGNGAPGYLRDEKSELFLLGVSNFVGEDTFYESAGNRDARFARLVGKVAIADLDWLTSFVRWLRNDANLRSASLVAALEGAKALRDAGLSGGRGLVVAAMARADEPGEALAYWFSNYGRRVPQSVKRGVADAASTLYNEYSLAKYDSVGKGFRFGDVIDLVHPNPKDSAQSDLFKYALDRRRDSKLETPTSLSLLKKRAALLSLSKDEVRALVNSGDAVSTLKAAGLTWEALSGIVSGGMDAAAWEAVIPSMGYMALLRNLRNFEQAGVSDAVLDGVAARLADPEQVAKSRQLPMRFLSAYNATKGSLRFGYTLEKALNASLANVPALSGRTLVLVDRSGSMFWANSEKSGLTFADTAAVFGTALALRGENVDLVEFANGSSKVSLNRGDSILKVLDRFRQSGGTATAEAVRKNFNGHDRVIILTDEQANSGYYGADPTKAVPASVPVYTFNLAGYQASHGASGTNRVYFGGLTDACFGMIPLIEKGRASQWPWLSE